LTASGSESFITKRLIRSRKKPEQIFLIINE